MSDIVAILRERAEEMEYQEDHDAMVQAADIIADLRKRNDSLARVNHMLRFGND